MDGVGSHVQVDACFCFVLFVCLQVQSKEGLPWHFHTTQMLQKGVDRLASFSSMSSKSNCGSNLRLHVCLEILSPAS